MSAPLSTPSTTPGASTDGGVVSRRVTVAERAALQYLLDLHPDRFGGIGGVLSEYSITEAVEVHRRAMAMAAESAS